MAASLSVVLPVRDAAPRLLRRALASTLRSVGVAVDVDVVVVDHGSVVPVFVDGARVVVVDRDVTFADALNAGVNAARGDVIARMDADDVMHPQRLRAQLDVLQSRPDVDVVSSRVKVLPRTTTMMRGYVMWQNQLLSHEDHLRERFIEQPVCHPCVMFRRGAFDDVGGYVDDDAAEDYDLFLRLLSAGKRFVKLPEIHLGWRQHEAQSTRRISRDAIAALKARHLVADFQLKVRPVVVVGAGKEGRRISRALAGQGATVTAFVDVDPQKQGRVTHKAPVYGPTWLQERPSGAMVIGAVGTSGSRGAIRALWRDSGVVEGADGICVA